MRTPNIYIWGLGGGPNRDILLMENLVTFFKCGRLEEVGSATSFVVTKLTFLTEIIIPFFK